MFMLCMYMYIKHKNKAGFICYTEALFFTAICKQ